MRKTSIAVALGLALALGAIAAARADTDPPKDWQDVRALVVRFNDAQNAHNIDVISVLLLNSPTFVWTTGSGAQLGHDDAVNRLASLYQNTGNTFSVLPDYGSLTIQLVSPAEAAISFQTQFKTSPPGQDTQTTTSVVRERAVKTPQGWRLASVDTTPSPTALF